MADRDDEKTYTVIDWLGLRDAPRWGLARPLGVLTSVATLLLWVLALAAAVGVLLRSFSEGNTGLGAGGLMVALLGAPFLIWSTVIKHNTLAVSRQMLALSETALFNDKVNAALEGLYSRRQITRVIISGDEEKVLTEWEDDIVQRNGAIDRLEGLANERPSEVPRIANMLSVYVRELSNGSTPESHPRQELLKEFGTKSGEDGDINVLDLSILGVSEEVVSVISLRTWAEGLKPFRTDVEKAAQTLGRLLDVSGADPNAITIDLRGANLQGFDLEELCFANARLDNARMEGVNLTRARMEGAKLMGARMEVAKMPFINMERAELRDAQMDGARASGARFEGTDMSRVKMAGTRLVHSRFRGANLHSVQFDDKSWIIGADFSAAAVSNTDFSIVRVSMDQIKSMFGDGSVILPNGIIPTHPEWPAHWPKFELGLFDFDTEWEKWKSDPAAYVPPVKPDPND